MEDFKLFLSIVDALGSVATAIGLFITLFKFKKKLKISHEFPVKKSDILLISINNNTIYDSEIKSISFSKGNPKHILKESNIFYTVSFNEFDLTLNPNTNNIVVPKGTIVEVPIPCKCIACNYESIGEAFGKPYDNIFVFVRDNKGHTYSKNTQVNIDYFRKVTK